MEFQEAPPELQLLKAYLEKTLDEVLGTAVTDGELLTDRVESFALLKRENKVLKQRLDALIAVDNDEFNRLYKHIGVLEQKLAQVQTPIPGESELPKQTEKSQGKKPAESLELAVVSVPEPQTGQAGDNDRDLVSREPLVGALQKYGPALTKLAGMEGQLQQVLDLKDQMAAVLEAINNSTAQNSMQAEVQQLQDAIHQVPHKVIAKQKAQRHEVQEEEQQASAKVEEAAAKQRAAIQKQVKQLSQQQRDLAGQVQTLLDQQLQFLTAENRGAAGQAQVPEASAPVDFSAWQPLEAVRSFLGPSELPAKRTSMGTDEQHKRGRSSSPIATRIRGKPEKLAKLGAGSQAAQEGVALPPPPRTFTTESLMGMLTRPGPSSRPAEEEVPEQIEEQHHGFDMEDPICTEGQITADWQRAPWRCSLCCLGFHTETELKAHFQNPAHLKFASDVHIYTFGREAKTQRPVPDHPANRICPLPRFNRQSYPDQRAKQLCVWICPTCEASFSNKTFLQHLLGRRHRSNLS